MADNMELDDLMEIVTLEDEEGNATEFELADQIHYEGKEYVVKDGDIILFRFNV